MKTIEKCSCAESQHMRKALKEINRIATTHTGVGPVDDLAQIANLAYQGDHLEALDGDPGVPGKVRTRSHG